MIFITIGHHSNQTNWVKGKVRKNCHDSRGSSDSHARSRTWQELETYWNNGMSPIGKEITGLLAVRRFCIAPPFRRFTVAIVMPA
jgi:hypothetical protein